MQLGNLNAEEFDTIFELIITILFMSFGVFAISQMVDNLSARVEVSSNPDKIAITYSEHEAEDPFYFTGYQAYMFAWHMDETSYESLSYVGGKLTSEYDIVDNNIRSKQRLDDVSDNKCVTLSVIDENGDYITQFLTWRNQMITGQGLGANRSVMKTINSLTTSDADLVKMYRGTLKDSSGSRKLYWHLSLTGDYTMSNDLGYSLNEGGKTFRWVLEPTYR